MDFLIVLISRGRRFIDVLLFDGVLSEDAVAVCIFFATLLFQGGYIRIIVVNTVLYYMKREDQ